MTDIFTKAPAKGQTDTEDDTGSNDTVNPLDYVSSKFKNAEGKLDIEALAKAKYEADRFIQKLEDETEGMRRELNTRLTLEEFMREIKSANSSNSAAGNQNTEPSDEHENQSERNGISTKEIEDLINTKLSETQTKIAQERNVEFVASELTKKWGNNYQRELVKKAEELGLGRDFLSSLAATQPKAFLALVGISNTQENKANVGDFSPPKSGVNTSSGFARGSDKRNFSYYEKLRKENPRDYWSRETQREIHKMASDMGEDFYK